MIVYSTQAIGETNQFGGYGGVRGLAANMTANDFHYIQVTFGLYINGDIKYDTCSDNLAGLGSGDHWEIDTYCASWRDETTYRLENVTYY